MSNPSAYTHQSLLATDEQNDLFVTEPKTIVEDFVVSRTISSDGTSTIDNIHYPGPTYIGDSPVTDEQPSTTEIPTGLFNQLNRLGLIPTEERSYNVGESNYSEQLIQPWSIWIAYPHLTSFDHDIIKRVLRNKSSDSRKLDYQKIIHICNERIRQLDLS